MSAPGVSAQRGYRFQDYVALYYTLELLRDSDLLSVEVESTGLPESENELHVDDVIVSYRTGRKRFVQIKMTAEGMTTWNMKSLQQKGELEKIVQQLKLNAGDTVELICPHGFGDLEELWNDNIKFHDVTALNANGSKAAKDRLNEFCELSKLNEKSAFGYVRQLTFGARHRLQEWKSLILDRLSTYAEDPDRALETLLKLVKDHQCKDLHVPSLLTADVLKNCLYETELLRQETEQPSPSTERIPWIAELIVAHTSNPMELKPIGQTDFDSVGWKRSGPLYLLAIRPRRAVESRLIDYLEEKFSSKENVLPIFSSGFPKVTARIKDGLCAYNRLSQLAPPPVIIPFLMDDRSRRRGC
ncbi:dsDNA nuclease domain-containing protein [Undibacterium sp. WLX3042]|uniref:dsDNA nuclease domain-containing protein n=1 Tax=Undibacterium sp. WLX3042 TaxID=3412686 RepID=UPI003C3061DE